MRRIPTMTKTKEETLKEMDTWVHDSNSFVPLEGRMVTAIYIGIRYLVEKS